ncbi:restriction endonuclease subunit S [Rhodococcus sp. ARC_M5]|uniref:restriction endonuclease subunit S n=1 Tax=Rhodococcus sp. ARC_M5 TaxID=2928851 RepID=UPI001FB2248E|nr:restriction endonuclease subunit S [Rhodococcus sp. ARC_M5]MCJ0895375.1 restriction endonuclease subunit S [Rhodococcus sp. ARC_M5]
MRTVPVGEFMVSRGGSVNPSIFPEEEFELYSIPAHDRGGPEIVLGSKIGSAKQIVQPGDVMVSKIIPHIRRSRIVRPREGRRQIASGEWIVFRSGSLYPNYLRHLLLSDLFHRQFMNTVAGVGGSLVRARPEQVKSIAIPIPPLEEQRRIAAILDQADALRAERRQNLARLDALARAIFHESFGSEQGVLRTLGEVATFVGGASLPGGLPFADQTHGTLLLKVSDMNAPGNEAKIKTTALWTGSVTERSAIVGAGAVVIPKRGASIATNKKRITTRRTALDPNLMGIQPNSDVVTSQYLYEWFRSFDLSTITSGSTVPQLNKQDLVPIRINVPAISQQIEFGQRQLKLDTTRATVRRALAVNEELFASVQSRAFRGEL